MNQFLSLVLNRLTEDSSSPGDGGLGRAMQNPDSPEFVDVKDELVKEIEGLLNGQTDTPTQAQTANTHQASSKALRAVQSLYRAVLRTSTKRIRSNTTIMYHDKTRSKGAKH